MANFMSSAIDDIFDNDTDLFCNVADSSLWDLSANVGESFDFSNWLDASDGDSVTTDVHNEIGEYTEHHNISDKTVSKNTGLTIGNKGALANDGLRRNMSKNAILARENREKKKRYILELERTVRDLSVKNKKLAHTCRTMDGTIACLRSEVSYLRGVIENQSELARLLKHIPVARPKQQLQESADLLVCDNELERVNASSFSDRPSFSASLKSSELVHTELMSVADCASLLTEHDYARSEKPKKPNNLLRHQFGVCLHVANQVTSLQLCALCNENAQ